MISLTEGFISKYQDSDVKIDPANCTETDFREILIYLAVNNQSEIKSLKEKVTRLDVEVECLTTAMDAKDQEITDLRLENVSIREKFDRLESEFISMKKDVSSQSDELLNLQRYTREWGLRFNNVAETYDANGKLNEDCVKIVESFLGKVGLPHVKIENAHRVGPKSEDGSPRTIAARCFSRPQRREVLDNRKKLFDIGIPTFESLCKFDADRKKRYGPVMKRLYDEGKRVYYTKGQVMVNGHKYAGPLPPPLPPRVRGGARPNRTITPVTIDVE